MGSLERRIERIEERLEPDRRSWLQWPNDDGTFTELPGCRNLADVYAQYVLPYERARQKCEANHGDGIRESDDESTLTARQMKFLPVLLASPTYTEACQKGRVSRDTLYEWLKDPAFKAELEKQRDELVAQGFALLAQSVRKAVETLVGLLDGSDGRLKRLAARDILDQHARFKELNDLTQRIETIEERPHSRQ